MPDARQFLYEKYVFVFLGKCSGMVSPQQWVTLHDFLRNSPYFKVHVRCTSPQVAHEFGFSDDFSTTSPPALSSAYSQLPATAILIPTISIVGLDVPLPWIPVMASGVGVFSGLSAYFVFGDVVPVFCSLSFLTCSFLLLGYEFFRDSGSLIGGVSCKHFLGQ